MPRPLHTIAREIVAHWPKPYFGAVPYIRALAALDGIDDAYGYDSARSCIIYFLGNAATWRGSEAKRIKAELKQIAGIK